MLLDQQLAEVLTPLGIQQEMQTQEEAYVYASEPPEQLQISTHYLHVLCPLVRRLDMLAQAAIYLQAHHNAVAACVSQGITEKGQGFLVFASQRPFQDVIQQWLTQQLMVDAYRCTVSVDIDLF